MPGLFITFEGTEGSGKSTQIKLLAERLSRHGREPLLLREPGGTKIGEEIRQTLIHSKDNAAMFPETELLLLNASRAQLVREIIRPALARDAVVVCDRFYHSTIAYQGFGRQMDMRLVRALIDTAVGPTKPELTLLLRIPLEVSLQRRAARATAGRDRFEEEDRQFFCRVEQGYDAIADEGGMRVRTIDATQSIDQVHGEIWRWVEPLLAAPEAQGQTAWKTIGEFRRNEK